MKKLYTLTVFTLLTFSCFAGIITATSNGKWSQPNIWDLNRIPVAGDIIIVGAGIQVELDDTQDFTSINTSVTVLGTLLLKPNGKLLMTNGSIVLLWFGGRVSSDIAAGPSDMIKIGNVVKFIGGEADKTGLSFANSMTGTTPNGFTLNTLPVKFIGFEVARQANSVVIEWATAEEQNSSHFDIQRSENGTDWNTIGTVSAAGNSSSVKSYSYRDNKLLGSIVYYRIRQVDLDGSVYYTPVRILKGDNSSTDIKIHANTGSGVVVYFAKRVEGNVMVKLVSLGGQTMAGQSLNNPIGQVLIPFEPAVKGIYVVTINDGEYLAVSKKVVF